MNSNKFEQKVRQSAEDDSYMLRDEDGFLFWVDNTDEESVYYHSDEGDTYRCSWEQAHEWFELVPTEESDYKVN